MFKNDQQLRDFMLASLAAHMWRGQILDWGSANQAVEDELAIFRHL